MLYPSIQDLTNDNVNRYMLVIATAKSARYITENLDIPTIGIGAGAYTSGQVLVSDDILGKYPDFAPKFSKKYADLRTVITSACADFVAEVKNGAFPTDKEAFHMPEADLQEWQKIRPLMMWNKP